MIDKSPNIFYTANEFILLICAVKFKSFKGAKRMQSKRVGVWVMAGVLALVMAGCAKPPLQEQKAAQDARNAAISSQAEIYAGQAMDAAKKAWDDAEAKMQQKVYTEAQAAYIAAKTGFEKAAGEVEAGKNAIMEENKAAVKSVEQGWTDLKKLASKKRKKLQAGMKNSWEADSKIVQEAMKKAKEGADPAEIKNALAEAKNLVEKWLDIFKK
jgi:hypothetical protein